ncbi:MAG: TonB-dependent receptor [Caulobacteraceae bacterium]|nr:TonB-dependent receptor [Caulobacteraceae bacterium]
MSKTRSHNTRVVWLSGVAACALYAAGASYAQAAPSPTAPGTPAPQARPAAPPPAPDAVSGVVVTATRPPVTTSVDSTSFSVANDVKAAGGSIADVLRNLPSVVVDLNGNLTLRGDAGVQIQVDGKPSPLFDGPARAQLLMSMPAKDIDRIEIATTPSAANSPEGSGGIINLIMKKQSTALTWSGGAAAMGGTAGDGRFDANYTRKLGKLTLSTSGTVGRQNAKVVADQFDSSGANPATAFDTVSRRVQSAWVNTAQGSLRADYTDGPEHLVGAFQIVRQQAAIQGDLAFASTNGSPALAYSDRERTRQTATSWNANLDWTHKLSGDNHDIDAFVSYGRVPNNSDVDRVTHRTAPAVSDLFETSSNGQAPHPGQLRLVYRQPLPGNGALRLGLERNSAANDFRTIKTSGSSFSTQVRDPSLSYLFTFRQVINAAYVTYQAPLGKLNTQLGPRVEGVDRTVASPITAPIESDRTSFYPTLNFTYALPGNQTLRGGYSRRINRPAGPPLSPFRNQVGPITYTEGNPRLQPENIDSYELAYQYRSGQTFRSATLYWRESSDEATQVATSLGNGDTLIRPENLGSSRSVGVELAATGLIVPELSYNLSGNLLWKTNDAANLGISRERTGFSVSANATLNWTPDDKDTLQLNAAANPKVLTAQGYLTPYYTLNLGWRRKLTDKVALTFAARDVLNGVRQKQVIDTPNLRSTAIAKPMSRGATLQLSYTFGQSRPPAPAAFDYSAPAAP